MAEGWEEAVAHALDQYASAIVVPEAGNMLHALERARGMMSAAAGLTASIAGDPGTESEESSAENAGPPRNRATRWQHSSPRTRMPRTRRRPKSCAPCVSCWLMQLRRPPAPPTKPSTSRASGEAMAVTKNGETFTHGVAAVGGSSISQSDLSLAARRDKALAQVKQLTAQDGGMAEQVAEAKPSAMKRLDRRPESANAPKPGSKPNRVEKSRNPPQIVASFTRQLEQLDRKITETQENRNEHQLKLDDLNRALASAQQSTAEHADFDELDERERTLERELNLTREHEVAAVSRGPKQAAKGSH